jgi:L-fuconolactonase
MFGSDWPACLVACGYDRVIELAQDACGGLSETEKDDVFGETAARWYGVNMLATGEPRYGIEP